MYGVQQTEFSVILDRFCPYGSKKSKFEKMKKTIEDIIILQMCTINKSHTIYDIWFLRYEVQQTEFFVILDHFLPFT